MSTEPQRLSNPANESDDDIDLLALLLVLLRGWKAILLFALLGLAIGVVYSRYIIPTYQSAALIKIESRSQGLSALGSNISSLVPEEASTIQTETELIKSRMVLQPVVDLLHLSVRLSDPSIGAIDRVLQDRAVTQLNTPEGVALETAEGQVQVSQFNVSQDYLDRSFTLVRSGSTNGFVLSNGFDDFNGQLNQPHRFRGPDGVIEITVTELPASDQAINISKQSLQNTTDAINGALTVVEKGGSTGILQLSMTGPNQQQISLILKQVVLTYIDQNQLQDSEQTIKTMTFMETQIPILKTTLEASEALFNDFRKQYGMLDVTREAELLWAEKSQIDGQLSELKLKKADLITFYTEEHPVVIQINDQFKVLNDRKQEIASTINGLPEIQQQSVKLTEDMAINKEIYLSMLKNYEQLKIVKAGQVGYARIIDLPISTYKTIAPKKQLIIMLALLSGALLGTMLVLLSNLLRNTVKDPDRLESKTGVPVIATIPRSKSLARLSSNKQASDRLLAYVDHDSLSYEAIKSLRTYLMFGVAKQAQAGQRGQVILVSGESPGVGKSFVAANLTEVFAQLNKKVLIMDGDMRLGELHKIFNIKDNTGLAEYFSQAESTVTDITHSTSIDNIDFIPRGHRPFNPSSLLASDRFRELMTGLIANYDYIIIDSPPVLAASDALVLSQYADKVLMVTRANESLEGQLSYAIKQMRRANIQVDGIVLNDMQHGLMDKYSYHYSYAYGDNK